MDKRREFPQNHQLGQRRKCIHHELPSPDDGWPVGFATVWRRELLTNLQLSVSYSKARMARPDHYKELLA
jgi:hypothetical protein